MLHDIVKKGSPLPWSIGDSDGRAPFKVTVFAAAGRGTSVLTGEDKKCAIVWFVGFITETAYGFKWPMNHPVSALE